MRRLILALAALGATPAEAAERRWPIGSVERLRVEAPLTVRVVTGAGTGVIATADDAAVLDALEVNASGGTLIVRLRGRTTAKGVVTVATPRLDALAVFAAATVSVDRMAGERVTLSVAGDGALTVARVEATALAATLFGEGTITLAGRAADARLVASGPGTIDAGALVANQLSAQAAGDAIVRASARYAAQVIAGKDSQVVVAGNPRCTVRAPAGVVAGCGVR